MMSDHSHPGSPWLTLLAGCECLKRHGVGEREGELGADFTSVVLPSLHSRQSNDLHQVNLCRRIPAGRAKPYDVARRDTEHAAMP